MSLVDWIPGGVWLGLAIGGPLFFALYVGLAGDWQDGIDPELSPWLWDAARWPRIRWLQAALIAALLMIMLAIVSP